LRVLLVEDDLLLGDAVREFASRLGHAVDWMQQLSDADAAFCGVAYELVLLDLRLPDGCGLQFLRKVQGTANCLCIVLTARDQVGDRIEALNMGADDYLVKPFDLQELGARIRAVTRRSRQPQLRMLRFGDLQLDLDSRIARVGEKIIVLTSREWAIVDALTRRPGATVSKQDLEEVIYAFGSEIESNAIEVYVSRVRRKLGRGLFETTRGMGYRLGNP
jgi:two-component system, OmpR family, response regulator